MSDANFKIYIDRLRGGQAETIDFSSAPEFLGIKERELVFNQPVTVKGEAYLIHNEVVLKVSLRTVAEIPCLICNKPTSYPVVINNFYLTMPTSDLKEPIWDYSEEVREAILLEVPFVVECNEGNCPERKEIAPYLAPPHSEEEGWQPFKDL
jgi:uncharacterized metal-binding protein YceD (DUF177 family)